jgi:O-antigen ligase
VTATTAGLGRRAPAGLELLIAVVGVAVGVRSGLVVLHSGSRADIVIPLGLVAAVSLALLAFMRFEAFVLAVLAIRSAVDATKLGASSPIGLDVATMIAFLFVAAGLLWVLTQPRDERVLAAGLQRRASLIFLAVGLVATTASARPGISLALLTRTGAAVMMLLVLEHLLVDRRRINGLVTAVFASAVLPVGFAAYQAISHQGLFNDHGLERIKGTFVHSNPFALYLTMIVIASAAMLTRVHGRARVGVIVVLASSGTCLLFTYTRGAWLAAAIGLLVVGVFGNRWVLAALLVCGVVAAIAIPSVSGRFKELETSRSKSGAAQNSFVWRLDYWNEASRLGQGSRITGIGPDMVRFNTTDQQPPHNDLLRAYVETGLLGVAAYLWLLFALALTAWRALRTAHADYRGVALAAAGCIAAFIVLSLSANVISQVVILWYVFAFAGIAAAVSGTRAATASDERELVA